MIIQKALKWANKILEAKKISSSTLDAEIILAFILKKPKEHLLIHPENKLTTKQFNRFKQLIGRRAQHEPVAYITGHKEFFGLDFLINKNVLIPRPETELLVEEAIQYTIRHIPSAIIDIGTGSGCIDVALAQNLSTPKIYATDISKSALKIARLNARRHNVLGQINFLQGNLLEPILKILKNYSCRRESYSRPFCREQDSRLRDFIIVANLPYLTTKEWQRSQPEIKKYEPRGALDGGPDGLKYFHELFRQLATILSLRARSDECRTERGNLLLFGPKAIILEIGWHQASKIKNLAKKYLPGYKVEIKKDLAGFDRIVIIDK